MAMDPETLASAQPIMSGPPWKSMALGQAAFAEGRFEDVISTADDAGFLNITHKWAYLFWVHTLAQAYERSGDIEKAIETLELAALQGPLSIFETAGTFFWQRNHLYLHDLYLKAGRNADAENVEAEIRDMLRLADADHPFLVRLNGRIGDLPDSD